MQPEPIDRRILCVPADRDDPAIADLDDDIRRCIERIHTGSGYTESTCDECMRKVSIGPLQRARAERLGDVTITCYICVDPATISTYVTQLAART